MDIMKLDLDTIPALAGDVALTGAIRVAGAMGDDMFEYIVGIVAVIYEMYPGVGVGS